MKNPLLAKIASGWKLEAKMEDSMYFYNYKEVQTILDNKRCYVIGRKGAGKTAICSHIVKERSYDYFSERLTFKNFPFNELYGLRNEKYTAPNQYITIWKYLIYSSVCKMMVNNERIDGEVRHQLSQIYPKNDVKQLARKVSEWTSAEFGVNILGNGGNLKTSREISSPVKAIEWIDKVNILEDIIINYCDDSKYYIVFDELDEFRPVCAIDSVVLSLVGFLCTTNLHKTGLYDILSGCDCCVEVFGIANATPANEE